MPKRRKITTEEVDRLKRILAEGGNKVFGVEARDGSSRRVRLFTAAGQGQIHEITQWLTHAGHRLDKQYRIVVTGHGFCAVHHVVDALRCLAEVPDLRHERL